MGFYNILSLLFKNICGTLKSIRKLLFMVIFVALIIILLENTCFASTSIDISLEQGAIDVSGNLLDMSNRVRSGFVKLPAGDYTLGVEGNLECYIFYYSLAGDFKGTLKPWTTAPIDFTLSSDYLIRFVVRRSDGANITPSDVSASILRWGSDLGDLSGSIDKNFADLGSTITDSNINLDNNLPTIQIQDITQVGFGELFTKIRDAFTKDDIGAYITFTLPFVNKTFTLSFYNIYGNFNLTVVKQIVTPFWYFVVSLYIVKDIAKQLNKLKSGNIDNVANENVKEDLL